jgi:hypothetical protein
MGIGQGKDISQIVYFEGDNVRFVQALLRRTPPKVDYRVKCSFRAVWPGNGAAPFYCFLLQPTGVESTSN